MFASRIHALSLYLQIGTLGTQGQQRKGSPWWKGRGAGGGGFPERGLPEKVRDELGMGGSVERKSKHLHLSNCKKLCPGKTICRPQTELKSSLHQTSASNVGEGKLGNGNVFAKEVAASEDSKDRSWQIGLRKSSRQEEGMEVRERERNI